MCQCRQKWLSRKPSVQTQSIPVILQRNAICRPPYFFLDRIRSRIHLLPLHTLAIQCHAPLQPQPLRRNMDFARVSQIHPFPIFPLLFQWGIYCVCVFFGIPERGNSTQTNSARCIHPEDMSPTGSVETHRISLPSRRSDVFA